MFTSESVGSIRAPHRDLEERGRRPGYLTCMLSMSSRRCTQCRSVRPGMEPEQVCDLTHHTRLLGSAILIRALFIRKRIR